jgi:hypothetical protein
VHKEKTFFDWLLRGVGMTAEDTRLFDVGAVRIWYGEPETTAWSSPCDSRACFGTFIPSYKGTLKKMMEANEQLDPEGRDLLLHMMITAGVEAWSLVTEKRILDSFTKVGMLGYRAARLGPNQDRYVLDSASLAKHREQQVCEYGTSGYSAQHTQHARETLLTIATTGSPRDENVKAALKIAESFDGIAREELELKKRKALGDIDSNNNNNSTKKQKKQPL